MEHATDTDYDNIISKLDLILFILQKRKKGDVQPSQDLADFIGIYNRVFGSHRLGNAKTGRQLNARLKEGYTLKNMEQAMVEARKEQRHIETKYKWLTPEFFTRPDKLDMYIPQDTRREVKKFTTYEDMETQQ